ncbi:hypothetical protein ACQ4PT_032768 [Festuca glaucescens]
MGAGDGRAVAAVSAAAATNAVRARTDDEVAAVGAGDDRVVAAESAAAAGDDRVVAAVSAAATADVSIGATYAVRHAPMHATVDPLVHGPVQRPVDQALVAQRAVVADARVMVGPLVDRPVDRPAFPVLEASAADSNLAAAGGVGEGSFRVGALTVSLPASPCKFSTNEPPSLQTLDSVAGPFVPRLLLGLEAFASPASPAAAHQDGPLGQDDAGPFGQDDDGLGDVAGANCQVLSLSNPPSPVLDASRVDELSDDEVNGVDLAEILENEVTVTNLHSCAGPNFILDVTFSCTSTTAANSEAHARIKCVYFPIVKGKESIDSILEMLRENASGTDLAQHDLFTKALRCLDGSSRSDSSDVNVDVRSGGRSLNFTQLEKQYHDWINNMHAQYDVEIDEGDNDHTVIINPSNKDRLGISEDGEARLICRSIEFSDKQGCLLEEGPDSMCLNIQESVSFPISMIDNDKCHTMENDSWRQILGKKKEKAPACIEVLRNLQGSDLTIERGLPFEKVIMAGYKHPREIIARCKDSSIITHETEITVRPNSNTRRWQLSSVTDCSADNAVVNIRLGMPVRCLAARSHDSYGNGIPFQDIRKAVITIVDGNYILAQVEDIEVELSSDSMTLNIRDFLFKTSKLDIIRPKYEAMLKISLSDNEFFHLCPCKVMPGLPSTINMDMCLAWEKNLTPGEVIDDTLLEVFDHCGNHVEEGTELMVGIVGLSFVDKHGHVQKVNSEGFVDLSGLLRVTNGFGSQACLKIFHHQKEIFATTFQISIRNLEAVKVPQSCQAGTLLENIIFEVSDSDGLIDESIHGPLHTLSIRSNEKLVEGAQYTFERGRCIVSHVPVPLEPGTVTFVAYHTHFPDLETTIQIPVYTLDLVLVKGENESESICGYPTSSVSSQNTIPPSQLVLSQSNCLASNILGKFSDEIRAIDSDICTQEVLIKAFDSRKKTLENDIVNLQDEISHTAGSATGAKELTRHKIEENVGTAAAVLCTLSSRQCFMDDVVGIVALLGTVADRKMSRMLSVYLGEDNMLAVVCKTQAAANYFEKYAADGSVDVHFGIHQEAANLGAPIRKRFPIICLDLIRPYTGGLHLNTKQKPLALPFPHSKGFRGFAVNMIGLSPESLTIVTDHGYGLRETLFYRLFGELQVYETRDDMWQAIRHLKNGAISLDGGIIKGDGMLILGYSDPEVTFPVVPRAALDVEEDDSEYVCNKIKTMHAQMGVVKTLENRIRAAEEQKQKLVMERNKRKRKFDEISEVLSQPSGSGDHQLYE